jgi:hypothetical protein
MMRGGASSVGLAALGNPTGFGDSSVLPKMIKVPEMAQESVGKAIPYAPSYLMCESNAWSRNCYIMVQPIKRFCLCLLMPLNLMNLSQEVA